MQRASLAVGLLVLGLLAACTVPAEPTPAQLTIVQPGIEAEERGNYGFARMTYGYWAWFDVPLAQYRLARLYESGHGVDQDDRMAAKWYRSAADHGYRPAFAPLAVLYEEGRGVPEDQAKAFELYQKAAAGGDVAAHYRLGRLLESGRGTTADPAAAAHYRIAAEAGNADALLALADLYRTGRGLPEDGAQAAQWYRRALAQRDSLRTRYLLTLAQQGERALPRLESDAAAGIVPAYVTLGDLYEGEAVDRDPAAAVRWWRMGAEHGDGEAAFKIAAAFEQGRGVPPDLVEALAWYGLAQRYGYPPAAAPFAALSGELPSVEVQEARRRLDRRYQEFGSS
jgi:TPR repeat protein